MANQEKSNLTTITKSLSSEHHKKCTDLQNAISQINERLSALTNRFGTEDIIKQREDEVKMLTEQNLRLESETTKWSKAL